MQSRDDTRTGLTGRVALVTGSARRLGRHIARALAEAGADIAIHHHASPDEAASAERELAELGVRAAAFQADITDPDEVRTLFADLDSRFGRIDILVNNAAVFQHKPVLEIDVADWDHVLDLNLRGPFLCCQEAARRMQDDGGHIVNIADVAAFEPWPGYAHHCVSKAGLVMLTRVLARALAPAIRVNAVAPGPVLPPENLDADARRELAARTALGTLGTPEAVARTVLFLLLSEYITGETVLVDGGKTLMTGRG